MLAALTLSALLAFAEEPVDENAKTGETQQAEGDLVDLDFVRFTASGNDPYGTFHFKLNGENTTIDPDSVVWAAIRYRTHSQFDTTGVEFGGQFYVIPEREPCVPVKYVFSGEWETAIVDLTAVSANTEFDSIWDSLNYTSVDIIRFDPLEPNRDSEDTSKDETSGKVKKGDNIDVAWIAFFETEYAARTYTGRENTPAAILDADSLSSITNPNKMVVTKLSEKAVLPTVAPATEVPTQAPTKEPTEKPTAAPATDAPVNTSAAPDPTAGPGTEPSESKPVNIGLIVTIVIAALAVCAIAIGVILRNKKK